MFTFLNIVSFSFQKIFTIFNNVLKKQFICNPPGVLLKAGPRPMVCDGPEARDGPAARRPGGPAARRPGGPVAQY